jgi:hypothetical protein
VRAQDSGEFEGKKTQVYEKDIDKVMGKRQGLGITQ